MDTPDNNKKETKRKEKKMGPIWTPQTTTKRKRKEKERKWCLYYDGHPSDASGWVGGLVGGWMGEWVGEGKRGEREHRKEETNGK